MSLFGVIVVTVHLPQGHSFLLLHTSLIQTLPLGNSFAPPALMCVISNNINNFRELLPNDTTHYFRVHIKQYSHFQRVTTLSEGFLRV